MNAPFDAALSRLRSEAAIEPDAPVTGPIKKETQIIAIYGKGGIGKSFTLANLSYMMAQQGKRVLLIGCDPKSDTTSLLFGGRSCPTIIETSSKKKLAGEAVKIGDVCFKRDGVFAMELGGPEVGRGCGGRGIIHGFELLEKLGFHEWGFDYVLLDFLGDVVCGGFGLPIARDMCQKVIVVGSNDLQSLYVANNVCSAVDYFRKLGGNVGVAGMVINKDDGTGEAQAFASAVGIPVLSAIPADDDIRRKSASYEIIGKPGGRWAPVFEQLAEQVALAPPVRPSPLSHDGLLGLFASDTVGRDVVLDPATLDDMCAATVLEKPSLEVIYEGREMDGDVTSGCHGGRETMLEAARTAGKSESLDRLLTDYPRGPHDQPQSMCPAFGSLRVGLRMRRTATILSGSACCVYGLTFTSHFYGAKRTVGYVPFNSESLVRGQLYEDIRNAVFETAKPEDYDAVVVINLCVPTASGVPLDRLPKAIDGVRIIGIDVPGFGVPTHAEAKDVLAGAMLRYARTEAESGPVARPRAVAEMPTVSLIGELFPLDPVGVGALLAPMGLAVGPQVPSREWRDLYGALDCAVAAAVHPFYTASIREMQAAGRPVVGSGPVGVEGTADWLDAISKATGISADAAKAKVLPAIQTAFAANMIDARITVSGYEGSELLVARLLIEAGADVPYVGTACPRTEWSEPDRVWLEERGTHVQYRASLEQDIAAMQDVRPDLAVGTTPLVQKAKALGIPALYFTNMVSARPLFGAAGAGALAAIVAAQTKGRERFSRMVSFFDKVGVGETAGYGWTDIPKDPPGSKERYRKAREAKAKATQAVGT